MSWRDNIRPVVAAIIEDHRGADMKTIRKALADARPTESYLYKVWLSEVRNQLKIKPPHKPDPAQPELF